MTVPTSLFRLPNDFLQFHLVLTLTIIYGTIYDPNFYPTLIILPTKLLSVTVQYRRQEYRPPSR